MIGGIGVCVHAHGAHTWREVFGDEEEIAAVERPGLLVHAHRRRVRLGRMGDLPGIEKAGGAGTERRGHPGVLRMLWLEVEVAADDGGSGPREAIEGVARIRGRAWRARMTAGLPINTLLN